MNALECPECHRELLPHKSSLICSACSRSYPIHDGIPLFAGPMDQYDGFDRNNFEFLYEMERRHFWHVARKKMIYRLLERTFEGRLTQIRMLEIGCGNGSVLQFLASKGVRVEGGDLFVEALQFCRQRVDVPLYQIDACATPFHSGEYDIVGAFDVIEHINDDNAALREMYRICKPGGRVFVTVPAGPCLWSRFDVLAHHKRRYTRGELCRKLQRAGFSVEKLSFYVCSLFPIFFVFRMLSKARTDRPTGSRELSSSVEVKTIPVLNELLLAALELETRLLRFINLPVGTSLVALAKKE